MVAQGRYGVNTFASPAPLPVHPMAYMGYGDGTVV
jgi:hypothetical protein